ncbi:MAG: aminotransferase class IV [Planctomycetes bacterium]|nr:aminotransferase class IV [Planctomycetota bacterium]
MAERVVYFNGVWVPEREARLSIYDSALVMGDMAFDVTRTFHQRPFHLGDHLQRLAHSLQVLRIDPGLSLEQLEAATLETLRRNLPTEADDVDWNIIHNVSRGPAAGFEMMFPAEQRRPTVLISCVPLVDKMATLAPAYDSGIDLVVPAQRALPSSLWDCSIKTRSRAAFQVALQQAAAIKPGAVPALVDPDGHLTETTNANLFLVRDGVLCSPLPKNVLAGVTRGVIASIATRLGIARREMNLTVDDARGADELLITSTSIGVLHARSFDGRQIGDGHAGPITLRLREALGQEVGLDFVAQARAYAARQPRTT